MYRIPITLESIKDQGGEQRLALVIPHGFKRKQGWSYAAGEFARSLGNCLRLKDGFWVRITDKDEEEPHGIMIERGEGAFRIECGHFYEFSDGSIRPCTGARYGGQTGQGDFNFGGRWYDSWGCLLNSTDENEPCVVCEVKVERK